MIASFASIYDDLINYNDSIINKNGGKILDDTVALKY